MTSPPPHHTRGCEASSTDTPLGAAVSDGDAGMQAGQPQSKATASNAIPPGGHLKAIERARAAAAAHLKELNGHASVDDGGYGDNRVGDGSGCYGGYSQDNDIVWQGSDNADPYGYYGGADEWRQWNGFAGVAGEGYEQQGLPWNMYGMQGAGEYNTLPEDWQGNYAQSWDNFAGLMQELGVDDVMEGLPGDSTGQPSDRKAGNSNHASDAQSARPQFLKTRMCQYHKRKRCLLGDSCPFAHHEDELQPAPDLYKTRLCHGFHKGLCKDTDCKYAHGYGELRATDHFYKTRVCRWWLAGVCRAQGRCRFAHGEHELKMPPASGGGAVVQDFESSQDDSSTEAPLDRADGADAVSTGRAASSSTASRDQEERATAHVKLRLRKTFLETLHVEEEGREDEDDLPILLRPRSFSCGDIYALRDLAEDELDLPR
mmetsp:Transcript_15977/g.37667  ORF Transcript_15977/g.37667 Transcript_15977/m.37667 type:complete len:430 (+) Transcript_15977:98-1387(+)